ncbi:MAG: hypothetical protein IJS45_08925 [Clostridia bacterium]|nr:hypothetical protein [Clostridia bacterium]
MKLKFISYIILLCLLFTCLASCSYTKVETDKPEDFDSTFLEARKYCTSLVWREEYDTEQNAVVLVPDYPEMLPKLSGDSEIVSYFAKCVEELPLGESVQILVSVKYETDADYNSEKQRISGIKSGNLVLISDELFDKTSILSTASLMDICEYVICYDDDQILTYVYLQSVKEEDILFDHKYLPKGYYDYGKIPDLNFSIYNGLITFDENNNG